MTKQNAWAMVAALAVGVGFYIASSLVLAFLVLEVLAIHLNAANDFIFLPILKLVSLIGALAVAILVDRRLRRQDRESVSRGFEVITEDADDPRAP